MVENRIIEGRYLLSIFYPQKSTFYHLSSIVNMKQGFTLIELLISIAILGLTAGIGGNILVASIQSYNKSQSLNTLTQNGGFAMTTLKNEIQSAASVTCPDAFTLNVINKDGVSIFYSLTPSVCPANGSLTRASAQLLNTTGASPTLQLLASLNGQSSGFVCAGNLVTITLALSQPCGGGRVDETASTVLTTSVVVRGGYQ